MTDLATMIRAIQMLPLKDGVRLGAALWDMHRHVPGSVGRLAQVILDHPELESLVFELLDGYPSPSTIVEVA